MIVSASCMSNDEIAQLLQHEMNFFLPELLVPKESMPELIEAIRKREGPRAADILAPFPRGRA